ncbi:TolC family protein [Neolewinella agarilytica]|uniref:Outer membrane protein TolC n=1 Tax=Neolewinella agarilytica TaxID=478744 RepID=A0A1H9H6C7_9BACT|nr:TolC family protein [Neolewinella agarilytica]SEQ57882.1 Outer membrane protein TolC [Neolewinella agarilytica]
MRTLSLLFLTILCTCVRAQSLDSLKAELRRVNPELRALQLDYEAAMRIGGQLDQLPDLEIGAGVFVLPVETRTGPQQFRVGATQMLPWPGKLAAMAATANARARPLLEKVAARQLMLIYQLEKAYFSLAGIDARRAVLEESLDLYASLNRLALSRVESGKGSSVDVYQIQMQRQQVERQLAELRYLAQQEMVTINELLNRPADTQAEARLNIEDRVEETLDFAPDLANDDPDLSNHPGLRIYGLQQEANRAAIELTKLDQRPDFGIGLDYIATGRREDMNPLRNGRDVILPRAMVTLPLSKGKFTAKRQEEEVRILALDARRESTENQFRAEMRRALNAIDNAANERYFLREQTRVINATVAIARSEFANGKRAFDELLRLENQLIGYRTKAVMAETTILLQRAIIDRYLINY